MTLDKKLTGIKGLIKPIEPKGHGHNWYNYTIRIDMKAIGWTGEDTKMRDAIMKAINSELAGAVGVWQNFILPDMTVFKAKNAYGKGCPWDCNGAGDGVDYTASKFPMALKHTHTHFGMTMPLRPPNRSNVASLVGDGIVKVFNQLDKIDPEQVLKG